MKKYDMIVFAHLFKPHLGGLEKYVENFYRRIPGKKILIVTSKYDEFAKRFETIGGLDVLRVNSWEILKGKYYIPSGKKGFGQIKMIFQGKTNYKTEIHTHTRFYFLNAIAVFFAKKYNLKHVHFEHGSSFVKDGTSFVRFIAWLFDQTIARYILKNAEQVYVVSEAVFRFLKETYGRLNYSGVLYNSIEFKSEKFPYKKKPNLLKMLYVGRLVKSKGVYELLDMCKVLKQKNFKFSLTIIGDGSEMLAMKDYVKIYGLTKDVTFKGSLPYELTHKEFPFYDMFINPSYTEGLPTTVLEAVSYGLIVVASDVGGTGEIIPKKLLINPSNINGVVLAGRVIEIIDHWDTEQKTSKSVFDNAIKRFSWDHTVASYLKSYNDVKEK